MVEITVDNSPLDLYPNEVVSLSKLINDMSDISTRNGGYSNKFKIPSTANNNSILGYPSELNFVTGFKPTTARNAKISIDGLTVESGIVQIEQYNYTDKTFDISFFSGNTEWADAIADKNMRDITLDKYNHLYLPSNVAASMTNTEGYIYPLINYGRLNTAASNAVDLINFMPAMYTHTLVREMFNDIDWKVGGSIFQDPVFLKHIIPFSLQNIEQQENNLLTSGYGAQGAFGVKPAATNIVYPSVFKGNQLGDYNPATGIYTATSNFLASVYCAFYRTIVGADFLEIRKNGVVVYFDPVQGMSRDLVILAGDQISITLSLGGTSPIQNVARNIFSIVPLDQTIEGNTMDMATTLPDMSQETFIQTIFNQFGVIFTSDNISKTVYLNRFEDIKNNMSSALDWTDKLDNSRDIEVDYTELVSNYGKKNRLGYEANEDSKNSIYGTYAKPTLGNGSFEIDNDFLSKSEELFKSEFVSSSSLLCFNGAARLMFVPRWESELIAAGEPDVDPLPRCAICPIGISVSDLFATVFTSLDIVGVTGTSNVTEVPYPYFDNSYMGISDIDDINQSLSFGNNIQPKAHNNLIDTYYEDFIAILNNPRKITVYLLLDERDINNLDFLTPIYLGGELNNYFYINKVSDYRPMDGGITKVELILIV